MILLAIDCAAAPCAACVLDTATGVVLGRFVRILGKGHAEHLMAVIDEALQAAGLSYRDLGAVAVTVGPGSFTGVRVGVSTARGLALALKIPAIGVTTLEAIAAETREALGARAVLVALDGGRGETYAAVYDEFGAVRYDPAIVELEEAAVLAGRFDAALAGSAAATVAALRPGRLFSFGPQDATADIGAIARGAAVVGPAPDKPRPLYLRGADAKPQASFVLPREGR